MIVTRSQAYLCLFAIFLPKLATAQSVSMQMGARSAGLGYSSVTISDEWSIFNNPAGLAHHDQLSAGLAHEIKFQLPGGNRTALSLATPVGVGVGVFRFGDDLYSEQMVSAAYANQFGLASLGLRLGYIQYTAEGFPTRGALTIAFGGIAKLTNVIAVGAGIQNINQPTIEGSEERLPVLMSAGLQFTVSKQVIVIAEISKDIDYDPALKMGLEYEIVDKLFFRTGFNYQPNAGYGGFGWNVKRLKIDYAIQFAHFTGISHQISVSKEFISKKRK